MFHPMTMSIGVRLLAVVVLATGVAAADDAEFAFNLFSDVAPVIALFGEQFARQFMSESLTWVDHLIFATVPLGILTSITGAIRVQGSQVARAFIGRARENRALTEIELMSSTSGEVCELFNGSSIVRAMGKPNIAEFLIFPKKYDDLAKEYKTFDRFLRSTKSKLTEKELKDKEPKDKSCGIQSLESAVSKEFELMQCKKFESHSTVWVKERLKPALKFFETLFRHSSVASEKLYKYLSDGTSQKAAKDEETGHFCRSRSSLPAKSQPKTSDNDTTSSLPTKTKLPPQGPPNLQLNISSDYFDQGCLTKGREIVLAAIAGVLLQTGLIAIAAVTVFYLSPRSHDLLESKAYGFPCYIVGSVMLSLGTGLCSFIVERSTTEHSWEVVNTDKANTVENGADSEENEAGGENEENEAKNGQQRPRLVWLQQYQTVNDQTFNGYVILAGPKRRVITSRRNDGDERRQFGKDLNTKYSQSGFDTTKDRIWQWLTVGAALSAGLGFAAQFMGLRGLAFPCSISQLGAIFLMALIRAWIRRRLGREPEHRLALSGYELDFLATHIVFFPEFRKFLWRRKKRGDPFGGVRSTTEFCRWEVSAPDPARPDTFLFESYWRATDSQSPDSISHESSKGSNLKPNVESSTIASGRTSSSAPDKRNAPPRSQSPSSQQLLRVRERLGELCDWTSKSSESALSLAQSVILFMDTFFPPPSGRKGEDDDKKQLKSLNWFIKTNRLDASGKRLEPDSIEIPVVRGKQDGKWKVEIGKIDAALSLWMAAIDAKRLNKRKSENEQGSSTKNFDQTPAEWGRAKATDCLNYSFCRIIGDNLEDEVLKRDVSWWVDGLIAEQSDPRVQDRNDSRYDDDWTEGNKPRWSRARYDVDLVIGFNGKSNDATACELGIASKAPLSIILAQHLFTSFMWTVAHHLPTNCLSPGLEDGQNEVEIAGSQMFESYNFGQAWLRPRFSHRQLTKTVRKIDSYGLGSTTDILLCMIPALSSMSLLPNEAILKLMPQVGPGLGWVETAICYKKLVQTIKTAKVDEKDKFSIAIIIATMDFLSFAHEPYDTMARPPPELDHELEEIVTTLVSPRFDIIMRRLAPVYGFQRRLGVFEDIFRHYHASQEPNHCLETFKKSATDLPLDEAFANNILGFTKYHIRMFSPVHSFLDEISITWDFRKAEPATIGKRDIFGWTAYHYSCLVQSNGLTCKLLGRISKEKAEGLQKLLDNSGRSLVHIAALMGRQTTLSTMLDGLNDESWKSLIHASGLGGMTLLHLVSKSGSLPCLELLTDHGQWQLPLAQKDCWDRQALHIASKFGHDRVAAKLLELGSRSDHIDTIGKSPVDYFVERKRGMYHQNAAQQQISHGSVTNEPSGNGSRPNWKPLSREENDLFLKFAMRDPTCRFSHGRTFLHSAVQLADESSIRVLLEKHFDIEARDNDERTPLHYAILAGHTEMARALIYGMSINGTEFRANTSAKDSRNTTSLMFAAKKNFTAVAEMLLATLSFHETDDDGATALHHASGREIAEFLVRKFFDPLDRDSNGRTALHTAIEQKNEDVARYLLGLKQAQHLPFDDRNESLLVTACKRGLTGVINEIIRQWPDIINAEDKSFGQSPLSWACENGHDQVVNLLIAHDSVEVNKIATGWRDYTPLHFAVEAKNTRCVAHLLEHSSTRLDLRDKEGKTPLRLAVDNNYPDTARMLLLHSQTSDNEKVELVKEFASSSNVFHYIISDVLRTVENVDWVPDFLLRLANGSVTPNVRDSFKSFAEYLKEGAWKSFKLPYHLAVLLGDTDLVKTLKEHDADDDGLDEDNWSFVDYITRFDRAGAFGVVAACLENVDTTPNYAEPMSLAWAPFGDKIQVTYCTLHNNCNKSHGIVVIDQKTYTSRVCIRSDYCIPPSAKHFYFEIEVEHDSQSRWLGIGFCGWSDGSNKMPGWFPRSWGYHGDDGKLYIESGYGGIPSEDFGEAGEFGSGDVVGVCLSMETGQGFCTLNGKRLNMGNAFKLPNERFKFGKLYPCVGFDVGKRGEGLEFVVNFDGSDNHPFKYKGPFDF